MSVDTDILRARRIDDRALAVALRGGRSRVATAAETMAAPRLVGALGGRWTPRIAETRRQDRLDVYENRALLGFIRWLDSTLADLARRLARAGLEDVAPGAREIYADRMSRWRKSIAALSRRDVFAGLAPEPALYATSMFRMHPDYAAAFTAMSRMRAGLGTGTAAAPSLPIDRTYSLYELWCYVGLLAAAVERFPGARQNVAEILRGFPSPRGLGVALARGGLSEIPLTSELRLTYQRRIGPNPSSDGARTLLVEAIPDVAISRVTPGGTCIGLVVLDPKYRAGASLLEGLRDMHVYRDAIVDANGARLVKAAVALAPRPKDFPDATRALPIDRPGIASARPGHNPMVFAELLDASLRALEIGT
jgi:hypothetical protein